jgi:hypothetical protein
MTAVIARRWILMVVSAFLVSIWAVIYFLWPRFSFDDGPFFAEPFAADPAGLSLLSSVNLNLLGATLFVLETRATRDPDPRTVFVLKDSSGGVRWVKVTSSDFGRIEIVDRAPRWFAAGGWVAAMKPEKTESGKLYLSPFGGFRFFFHSW